MGGVASVMWDAELAAVYDDVYAWEAEPSVVEPITGTLAELAGSGAALRSPPARGGSRSRSAPGELPSPRSNCHRTWPGGCAPSPGPTRSP